MAAVLGFKLDVWDYVTFAALFVLVVAGTIVVILIAGLPGRIAIARKHPEAEAVKIMGWAGLLPVWPWMQAFIWAFKPTDVVDIRRFPPEERQATDAEIARLTGKAAAKARQDDSDKPSADPIQ